MTKPFLTSLAIIATLVLGAPLAGADESEVTADQVVTALEGTFGVHPGERRNHIKGTCAVGEFLGAPMQRDTAARPSFPADRFLSSPGFPLPAATRKRRTRPKMLAAWRWSSDCRKGASNT